MTAQQAKRFMLQKVVLLINIQESYYPVVVLPPPPACRKRSIVSAFIDSADSWILEAVFGSILVLGAFGMAYSSLWPFVAMGALLVGFVAYLLYVNR